MAILSTCDFFIPECKIGYTSTKGGQCKPCSRDTFGHRCTEICLSCTEHERCDHIHGCTSPVTTIFQSSQQTESLGSLPIDQTTIQSEKSSENKDVSTVQKIYPYIFGGGGVFGITLLCTIFYKIRSYTSRSRNVVISPVSNSNAAVNRFEGLYDEIDETALDEFIQQSNPNNANVDEISSSSSGTDKNSASNFDDYLNPYQPILHTTENHTYRSTADGEAVSSIEMRGDRVCLDYRNPTYINVEQYERVGKSPGYSESLFLKYSELEIDNKDIKNGLDKYENTRIFQTERKSTPQSKPSTEYAEIMQHNVL
ncbi:MEGF10_11 [Mytilus coruscus]|uniref:MEGF10_11 n=1 Tax=Mytilus coruscus TaxID=42192 RepID=A0A6J8ESX4_MYTCO|nr:MEGF10_11 [Mytilus coruscus]